jgi:uncharacterized membrane protein YidH (DUF202 family)
MSSPSSSTPRYDRIVSLVLVVSLGLAVVLLIDINPNILRARLGGDLPTITVSWLLIGLLVIIASTGADVQARAHPTMQTRTLPVLNLGFARTEVAPGFWILPAFSVIGSFAFFRLFSNSLQGAAFVLALVAAGGLLLAVLVAQHYALDREPEVRQRALLVLALIGYLLAFGVFSAVYFERFRTLYSATLIGGSGALLAYANLRWTQRGRLLLPIAAFVGLLLGEVTWGLNYWPAPFLLGGALLLLVFYISVSLVSHYLNDTLQRRVIIEYALLGGGLFAAVVYATFS